MLPGSYGQLGALLAAIGLRTLCHELYSYIGGRLFKSMVARDVATFALFSVFNVVADLSTAVVEEAVIFIQNKLGVAWYVSQCLVCVSVVVS